MKRALVVAAVALLGVAAVAAASAGGANATPNPKVTICHATSSDTNPYTVNWVSESSIDEPNNQFLNGHGDHERDIIPPFRDFPGRNWDAAGQAIYNNGCVVPPPELDEVTPLAPTMIGPTCDAPGDVVLPTITGVEYTKTVKPNGSVEVNANATTGYVLAAGSTTTWTYAAQDLAQLPANDPRCVRSFPPTVPPLIEVTPRDPVLVDPSCDAPGEVVLPTITGVEYTETVRPSGTVTVTATAATGYVLAAGSTTTWTYAATQLAQLPADDPLCVASLPPTVPPDAPTVPPIEPTAGVPTVASAPPTPGAAAPEAAGAAPATTLPATGAETWMILTIGMASLLTGAGMCRLSRRRA